MNFEKNIQRIEIMDAFKLLCKSTNLRKPNQKKTDTNVPSSGKNNNPQIFGKDSLSSDEIDVSAGVVSNRKRKRKHASPMQEDTLHDINFFDGINANGSSKMEHFQDRDKHKSEEHFGHNETDTIAKVNISRMSEEERRKILKSHKIKVVKLENADHEDRHMRQRNRKKITVNHAEPVTHTSKIPIFPQPLMSFAEMEPRFGIDKRLESNLAKQAYSIPTEVQLAGIPLLLPEKHIDISKANEALNFPLGLDSIDLLTVAPTGSGKTLAFLIPLIQSLLRDRKSVSHMQGARAVILAPTKELASQIRNEAKKLIARTELRATMMRKGLNVMHQTDVAEVKASQAEKEKLSNVKVDTETLSSDDENMKDQLRGENSTKADILVATPMALLNAIRTPDTGSSALSSIKYLILDEADILLDPLFRDQTLSIWMACTNQALRVSLWSATMGSSIEELAISILNRRLDELNKLNGNTIIRAPLLRLVIGLKDSAVPTITHKLVYAATEQGKLMALRQLLHPTAPTGNADSTLRPPFLVFTQSIPRAIALHSELIYDIPAEAGGSIRIAVLHSDLSETARDRTMTRFRAGEIWVLITTDLLSRGVDFRGVNGVVNYDVPNSGAAYVHRAGRTGRAGREGGIAVTLYTKEDIPYVKNVANVIAASEKLKKGGGTSNGSVGSNGSKGRKKAASDVSEWLLDALPTPTKREKKLLKKRGVEARRSATTSTRISTKSGFERKLENNRKGPSLAASP